MLKKVEVVGSRVTKNIKMSPKFFILCCFVVTVSTGPASFLKKCEAQDSKCAKESTAAAIPILAAGIPELGVEPLDPYFFKEMDASTPTLKFILRNVDLVGLKTCKPKKIERDVPNQKLYVKLLCSVNLKGDYDLKGRLLFLPLEGKGKLEIAAKVQMAVNLDMGEMVDADGTKHWHIKTYELNYELKDKVGLNFKGLFPENDLLGRTAANLITSNSNEIVNEVGPPLIKIMAKTIIDTVNVFFHKVPAEELVKD